LDKHTVRIKSIVGEISFLLPRVKRTIDALKNIYEAQSNSITEDSAFTSPAYWRLYAF
jgi:hypothetical protein